MRLLNLYILKIEYYEKVIYSKNIKKTISFDELKEDILEKVIDAVTTYQKV